MKTLLAPLCLLVAACAPVGYPGGRSPHAVQSPHSVRSERVSAPRQRPDAPQLKRLENGHYKVRKPWTVVIGGREWHVQKGYTSNGITAPAKMKAMLGDSVDSPTTWAAVFHDWLFTQPGVTRAQADRTFHELLLAYGVPAEKAQLMYSTVSAYSLSKSFR